MALNTAYLERLGVHGPKLLKNIFLILVGGVAGAMNEIPERAAGAINKGVKNLTTGTLGDWFNSDWLRYELLFED